MWMGRGGRRRVQKINRRQTNGHDQRTSLHLGVSLLLRLLTVCLLATSTLVAGSLLTSSSRSTALSALTLSSSLAGAIATSTAGGSHGDRTDNGICTGKEKSLLFIVHPDISLGQTRCVGR